MKTIEQALDEAYKNAGSNAYFGNGFRDGVEFAQRWISVDEELPHIGEEVLVKRELRQGDTWVQNIYSVSTRLTPSGELESIKWSDVGFTRGIVTHWRPIELK